MARDREARREIERRYRETHREELRERARQYHIANAGKRHEAGQLHYEATRERALERYRQNRAEIRLAVFDHYGWSCACCGSTERLTIDHVNGGGGQHRREVFGRSRVSSIDMYRWLIRNDFPPGFQPLCAPCNRSKGIGEKCRINHTARQAPARLATTQEAMS